MQNVVALQTLVNFMKWIRVSDYAHLNHMQSADIGTVADAIVPTNQERTVKDHTLGRAHVVNADKINVKGGPEGSLVFAGVGWSFMQYADTPNDQSVIMLFQVEYELTYMRDTGPTPNLPMAMLGGLTW